MNDVPRHHRVEPRGLEPLTPCLQSRCATNCAKAPCGLDLVQDGVPQVTVGGGREQVNDDDHCGNAGRYQQSLLHDNHLTPWAQEDLNLRPLRYQRSALTA